MDRAALRSPGSPCRVLIVDDDRLQLRALERRARDLEDLEVTVVDNAIDALLRIGSLQPDVVVLDAFMPGVDGLEACRRLTSSPSTRDTKVILTSAAMTPDLERAAIAAGAHRVLAKPIDLRALLPRARWA